MIDPDQPQKGRVTNPSMDRRLRGNRGKFAPGPQRPKGMPWAQGRVTNPDTDRRLKKNRARYTTIREMVEELSGISDIAHGKGQ